MSSLNDLRKKGIDEDRLKSVLTTIAEVMANNAYKSLMSQDNITVSIILFVRSVAVQGNVRDGR